MDRELCFCIENKNIYLEQVLVNYMDIPIFFLCRDDCQFYIALCSNIDELDYMVVTVEEIDVYNLLHGKLPMRDLFLNQKEYWEVLSGEEISLDQVARHQIKDLDISLLPEENACFKILSEDVRVYVKTFDNEFWSVDKFDIDLNPTLLDTKLVDCILKISDDSIEKYVYVEEFSFRLTIDRLLRYIDLSGRYIPHNVKTVRIEEFTKLGNWKSSEMSYDAA